MIKWFADDTKLTTEKGKENNVLLFGGVVVDENAEKEIIELLKTVKRKYTYEDLPIKWNFKDLKNTYKEQGKSDDYKLMLEKSYEWRREIFEKSLNINYKIIISCLERYPSEKKLNTIKDKLINISFSQALMRVGMYAKMRDFKQNFEIILDWPEGSNPKPFNNEYYYAFNKGKSANNVSYHSGKLSDLKFNQSLYFTKCTHSSVLQFSDLIIGATKDYILKTIYRDYKNSLGYELTELIIKKYNGYPNKIIEYGLNYSPKNDNYEKVKLEIKNAVQQCITAITADSTTSESNRNC
nr:hypothetical protein [uncultured Brumimicrobium sp.]